MTVVVLERVPPGLRGSLTRWLLEVRPNVFVGTVSARIRDRLWDRAVKACKDGSVVMISTSRSEQGFDIRTHGNPTYQPRDFEGLVLITRPGRGAGAAAQTAVSTASGPTHDQSR